MARQEKRASAEDLRFYLGSGAKILEVLGYDWLPGDQSVIGSSTWSGVRTTATPGATIPT